MLYFWTSIYRIFHSIYFFTIGATHAVNTTLAIYAYIATPASNTVIAILAPITVFAVRAVLAVLAVLAVALAVNVAIFIWIPIVHFNIVHFIYSY
ncbi:hypothetical protein [Bathymodiolus japonicus methanotrophic gill symbiont]|uniref:hypothetical protein n=1 Tax=Bathymodiolus japonicus methanotrophic gill symbiont TaxID=113269 RepID=UPI001C8D5A6E|nr:hypothetical protein [Bathymodiolus japonicus methanotrophic gill symbiont]